APTAREPEPLAEADVAALMRELPLLPSPDEPGGPAVEGGEFEEIPDGMLVAQPASGMPRVARARLASWPAPDELEVRGRPVWRNPWAVGAFIAVLFGVGWRLGPSQAPDNDVHGTPIARLPRTVGLGGARFNVSVDSDPPGAWIAVDGKDVARRTPSTIDLVPGQHVVTLSMPDLGLL